MRETTVFRPDSIQALVKALQAGSSKPTLIAGGTDLVIKLQKRTSEPEQLIVLGDVPEMKVVSEHAKWLWIGASVRISELEKKEYPLELLALRDAASEIGSVQIRNIATIGGNIANASPSADFQPVLMALDADAQVLRADGYTYDRKVSELITGSGKTTLGDREVILGFKIPLRNDRSTVSAYQKLGYRKKVSITRIGLAVSLSLDESRNIIDEAQVWLAAVSSKSIFAEDATAFLRRSTVDILNSETFAELLSTFVAANSPRPYKTLAVKGLAIDTIALLKTRCQNLYN
jgi:xanthine dehydrogenase FAD-binding subunit